MYVCINIYKYIYMHVNRKRGSYLFIILPNFSGAQEVAGQ